MIGTGIAKHRLARRHFFRQGILATLAFTALHRATSPGAVSSNKDDILEKDPGKIIDLPEGFTYQAFSRSGETMHDGLLVPGKHDGMGAFPGANGRTVLVRNHEMESGTHELSPFGKKRELLGKVDQSKLYDAGRGKKPALGGTTNLVYDTKSRTLERHFLSLGGTVRNCAGGVTPWNTWITCEEDTTRPNASGQDDDDPVEQEHGYNFEVPAREEIKLEQAVPLKAMGRFRHEAVAVDPRTGIVYQTEDQSDGLLYRFIPKRPGHLQAGGRLQALRVKGQRRLDTRNFKGRTVELGQRLRVEWVDMKEVESPDDDLRYQGFFERDATRFARGEGIWQGDGVVYFACTNGGRARKGQIWKYTPSPEEGRSGERLRPGKLELFIEPNDGNLVENCDNLTIAPWGDLIVCEDGKSPQYLVGISPEGRTYKLGRTTLSEFAGACFSPDGSTLFVNIMDPGMTLAIQGPWERYRSASAG